MKKGDKVRLTDEGKKIVRLENRERIGYLSHTPQYGRKCVAVIWKNCKATSYYHLDFIELVKP